MSEQPNNSNKVEIIKKPHGPILVIGDVDLKDLDGNEFPHGQRFSLCGCGRSQKMPFCDGMHKLPLEG